MKHRIYYTTAAIIFGVITIVHLARITGEWEAIVAGQPIPMWVSWVAAIIAGYLAVRGFQMSDEHKD